MHVHTHDESPHVRGAHLPRDWGPDLAAAVFEHFERAPGERFLADLLKVDSLFPAGWHPMQRRERLNRLFSTPVQVEGLVFTIENAPGRMYEKTRRVVAREGSLPESAATARRHQVDRAPNPNLEARLRRLEERLDAIEILGSAPASAPDPEPPPLSKAEALQLNRNSTRLSIQFRRLVDALRAGDLDQYRPHYFPDEVGEEDTP